MTGELFVILVVGVLVFGPNKMPQLARHIAVLVRNIRAYRAQFNAYWEGMLLEQQLLENQKKASAADQLYHSPANVPPSE